MRTKDLKWSLAAAVRLVCWYVLWFTLLFISNSPTYFLSNRLPPQVILFWVIGSIPVTAFITHAIMVRRRVTHEPTREEARIVRIATGRGRK